MERFVLGTCPWAENLTKKRRRTLLYMVHLLKYRPQCCNSGESIHCTVDIATLLKLIEWSWCLNTGTSVADEEPAVSESWFVSSSVGQLYSCRVRVLASVGRDRWHWWRWGDSDRGAARRRRHPPPLSQHLLQLTSRHICSRCSSSGSGAWPCKGMVGKCREVHFVAWKVLSVSRHQRSQSVQRM